MLGFLGFSAPKKNKSYNVKSCMSQAVIQGYLICFHWLVWKEKGKSSGFYFKHQNAIVSLAFNSLPGGKNTDFFSLLLQYIKLLNAFLWCSPAQRCLIKCGWVDRQTDQGVDLFGCKHNLQRSVGTLLSPYVHTYISEKATHFVDNTNCRV